MLVSKEFELVAPPIADGGARGKPGLALMEPQDVRTTRGANSFVNPGKGRFAAQIGH